MTEARVVHRSTLRGSENYGIRVDHVSNGEIAIVIIEHLSDRKTRIGAKVILSPVAKRRLIRILKKTPRGFDE